VTDQSVAPAFANIRRWGTEVAVLWKSSVMALRIVSVALVAAGALVGWAAAVLHDPAGDPQWAAVGTAGGFAAAFALIALFKLEQARRRGRGAG